MKGIVKWFAKDKGYGFIVPQDEHDPKDIFVHINDIEEDGKTLIDGQHVEFDVESGHRGRKAKHVRVVPQE